MPANQSYIGQFGETLRRLTALSNAQPQAMGGADVLGGGGAGPALGGPPPQPGAATLGALQGGAGPQVPQGVLGGGPPPPPAAPQVPGVQGGANGQIGLSHLLAGATTDDKEHMTSQLESKGVDVDKQFSKLQDQGYVPDVGKMSRHDKGALLTEFGLRMMAASAQGADPFAAAGIAGQGLLESIRQNRQMQTSEAMRQQERGEDRADKAGELKAKVGISNAEITGRHEDVAAEGKSRENVARIEAQSRLAAAKNEARRTNKPMQYVSEDGTLKLITANDDGSFSVSTPTEDVETDQVEAGSGRNSMPHVTKVTKKKPVRPLQKVQPGNSVDPDTIQRMIETEKTRLANDVGTKRELRAKGITGAAADQEIERQARANVQTRMPGNGGMGGNDPLGLLGGGNEQE